MRVYTVQSKSLTQELDYDSDDLLSASDNQVKPQQRAKPFEASFVVGHRQTKYRSVCYKDISGIGIFITQLNKCTISVNIGFTYTMVCTVF